MLLGAARIIPGSSTILFQMVLSAQPNNLEKVSEKVVFDDGERKPKINEITEAILYISAINRFLKKDLCRHAIRVITF